METYSVQIFLSNIALRNFVVVSPVSFRKVSMKLIACLSTTILPYDGFQRNVSSSNFFRISRTVSSETQSIEDHHIDLHWRYDIANRYNAYNQLHHICQSGMSYGVVTKTMK